MSRRSIKKPNTLVLVTRTLSQNELVFLDILRVRSEALYLIASNAGIEDVQQHVEQAKVFSLETFLTREEQASAHSYDLLYIPGFQPNHDIEAALAANICDLFGIGLDVVAVGTGRLRRTIDSSPYPA
ncbi:hypothetical protein DAEQUDRAFT_324165 [Daedalea quercina L-15889]|uniref:DJ-1/PfpI domain-containing protein n=1 Tax=Daedalea quercina L-15889 TaxID=1314783 RepID=A0A165PTI9_9APHY|nr:hypothetical protein DAEQUDRAFT_324165 [Daedalea quercina L-15889]